MNMKQHYFRLLSLLFSSAMGMSASFAQGYYSYQQGDGAEITGGTVIDSVKNIVLTFGGTSEESYSSEGNNTSSMNDKNPAFKYYTKGNGSSPKCEDTYTYSPSKKKVPSTGTYYKFQPLMDGELVTYVVVNIDKTIWFLEEGVDDEGNTICTPVDDYPDGIVTTEKIYGSFSFKVKAGKTYYLLANGTQMGFYGFMYAVNDYILDEDANYVDYSSIGLNTFKLRRKMTAGEWTAVCFPFDMNANQAKYLFGADCSILYLDGSSSTENTLAFKSVSTLQAGHPALVKPSQDVSEKILCNLEIKEGEAGKSGNKSLGYLYGNYGPFTVSEDDKDIYFLTSGNNLQSAGTGSSQKGFNCYFKSVTGSTKPFSIMLEDVTLTVPTSLKNVLDSAGHKSDSSIYNLNGQRLGDSLNGLPAGIYICGGKKIIKQTID